MLCPFMVMSRAACAKDAYATTWESNPQTLEHPQGMATQWRPPHHLSPLSACTALRSPLVFSSDETDETCPAASGGAGNGGIRNPPAEKAAARRLSTSFSASKLSCARPALDWAELRGRELCTGCPSSSSESRCTRLHSVPQCSWFGGLKRS